MVCVKSSMVPGTLVGQVQRTTIHGLSEAMRRLS